MAVPTDNQAPLSSPSHTSEHQRVSDALALLVSTPWIALPFSAGWANYTGGGGPYEVGAYRKVGDVVFLQGLVQGPTGTTTMAVLPIGYRPRRQQLLYGGTGATPVRFDVQADGVISVQMPSATWLSLTNMSFSLTGA